MLVQQEQTINEVGNENAQIYLWYNEILIYPHVVNHFKFVGNVKTKMVGSMMLRPQMCSQT